ncbi:MAG TPA: 4'-phosphopantetheinyl transferase superfamily protein [Vicinamibacterales bacterium]|jgi:4'-phosphopantetheinyl transferase|nr:4'-phosphopantetheinyl transferase superfamily protein [Vicinamibacterales bacterium]
MVDPHPERVVHVLTVQQDDPDVRARLERYRALLSDDECARENRFYFDADKERFVIGRALARLQLSRFLGGDPRSWPLVTNRYGRPELASPVPPPIGFNVSHTQGLVACATAATTDIGVDVEFVRRHLTYDIAERFFAPSEVADLRKLSDEDQARVFFDYWTLKEAYIKARGMGLALPLAHFAFSLGPPAAPTIRFDPEIDDDETTWQFAQSWPTDQHRLAVAVRRLPGQDLDVRIEAVVPAVPA